MVVRDRDTEAEVALEKALIHIGLDPREFTQLRKDFTFIREWRETCELIRSRSLIVMITLMIGSIVGGLWLGFKGYLFS